MIGLVYDSFTNDDDDDDDDDDNVKKDDDNISRKVMIIIIKKFKLFPLMSICDSYEQAIMAIM